MKNRKKNNKKYYNSIITMLTFGVLLIGILLTVHIFDCKKISKLNNEAKEYRQKIIY